MKKNLHISVLAVIIMFSQNLVRAQINTSISSCNFSSNCQSVHLDTLTPSGNIWRIGQTTKTEFIPSTSAIVTDLKNPYPTNNNSYFDVYVSGIKNGMVNPLITFDHKYVTDTLHDGGYLEASFDNGKTWKNVINDSAEYFGYGGFNNTQNMYSLQDTINGNIPSFNGHSIGWIHSEVVWIWWMETKSVRNMLPSDTLIVRFHFKSDSTQTNKAGWIVDNIDLYNVIIGGINDISNNTFSSVKVSPNPVSESTQICILKDNGNIRAIKIYDLPGNCVFSENNLKEKNYTLHKGNLISGLYILKIEDSDGNIYSDKLIIN